MTGSDSRNEGLRPVVLVGTGGHALVVREVLRTRDLPVAGVVGPDPPAFPEVHLGRDEEDPAIWSGRAALVALGENGLRREVVGRLERLSPPPPFIRAIHPSAIVAEDCEIGEGTVLCPGVIINPGASIGRHVIVNSGAIVEHDVTLGDFSALAPGAVVGGGVEVGEGSFVGIGASVIHGVRIGGGALVGAGAVVVDDVPDGVLALGVPARVVRRMRPGETFLA